MTFTNRQSSLKLPPGLVKPGNCGQSLPGAVAARVPAHVAAARDVPGLAALRQSLRRRFEVSPLRDGAGLARAMEEAYRALWDAWRVGMTLAVAAE